MFISTFLIGRKRITGAEENKIFGSDSSRQLSVLFHFAPSKKRPRTYTPSYDTGEREERKETRVVRSEKIIHNKKAHNKTYLWLDGVICCRHWFVLKCKLINWQSVFSRIILTCPRQKSLGEEETRDPIHYWRFIHEPVVEEVDSFEQVIDVTC